MQIAKRLFMLALISVCMSAVVSAQAVKGSLLGTITDSNGAAAAGATVTLTETDIGVAFTAATYSVDEGATNIVLTVVQTGDTNSVASVDYATADVGAAAGSDRLCEFGCHRTAGF